MSKWQNLSDQLYQCKEMKLAYIYLSSFSAIIAWTAHVIMEVTGGQVTGGRPLNQGMVIT